MQGRVEALAVTGPRRQPRLMDTPAKWGQRWAGAQSKSIKWGDGISPPLHRNQNSRRGRVSVVSKRDSRIGCPAQVSAM